MEDEFNYTVTSEGTDEHAFVNGSTDDQDIIEKCKNADFRLKIMSSAMIYFAVLMITALGCIVRRKGLCLRCCWGRPGAVQPIDFVDEIGRRWAYGACFIIITSDVFDLFICTDILWYMLPRDGWESMEIHGWEERPGWFKELMKLLGVLFTCLGYFPLLACIDHRRSICANVLGIICVIPWILIYCQFFRSCPMASQLDLGFAQYIFRAPIFVSLLIVGFSYVLDFGININKWKQQRALKRAAEKNAVVVSRYGRRRYKIGHHLQYVENLMRRKETGDPEEGNAIKVKFQRTASRLKYEKVFGFRYSTRLICCVTMCTTLLVWLEFSIIRTTEDLLTKSSEQCKVFEREPSNIQILNRICSNLLAVKIVAHFSSAFSTVVVFIMLIHTLIIYKRRWHQLLRGDHSWHMLGKAITPHSTLLSGLEYGGYQVAFLIWGWLVLMFFVCVVLMFITFGFIIPLSGEANSWLIKHIEDKWPTVLLGVVIIPLIQTLICRFMFLQERGTVLALTNRRVYNAASYYFMIMNIIVGIFACLKRILIPLVLGIVFLPRLDRPLIMHGYESMDPGYAAFVSMLIVDLYHNHPVLKAFVEAMNQVRTRKETTSEDVDDPDFIALRKQNLRSKQIRNRWWKIVTLANNPSLALKALEQRLIRERLQITQQIAQDTETKNDAKKQERAYL